MQARLGCVPRQMPVASAAASAKRALTPQRDLVLGASQRQHTAEGALSSFATGNGGPAALRVSLAWVPPAHWAAMPPRLIPAEAYGQIWRLSARRAGRAGGDGRRGPAGQGSASGSSGQERQEEVRRARACAPLAHASACGRYLVYRGTTMNALSWATLSFSRSPCPPFHYCCTSLAACPPPLLPRLRSLPLSKPQIHHT